MKRSKWRRLSFVVWPVVLIAACLLTVTWRARFPGWTARLSEFIVWTDNGQTDREVLTNNYLSDNSDERPRSISVRSLSGDIGAILPIGDISFGYTEDDGYTSYSYGAKDMDDARQGDSESTGQFEENGTRPRGGDHYCYYCCFYCCCAASAR
jgi:hypothetical protein